MILMHNNYDCLPVYIKLYYRIYHLVNKKRHKKGQDGKYFIIILLIIAWRKVLFGMTRALSIVVSPLGGIARVQRKLI